ncbi:hypothetical protein [Heyndrickxia vini]|uniref:Uncharacterized protein n=1 Tax=Heyndrickxia vini TaxID=1476025 RepID=A0ABX7E1U3_9BACI|nr:hypothetical protein [Heyndrickxia vini]QQZ09684.1 hypothetical protein I5776_01490 [Heyndrickxia vini]
MLRTRSNGTGKAGGGPMKEPPPLKWSRKRGKRSDSKAAPAKMEPEKEEAVR